MPDQCRRRDRFKWILYAVRQILASSTMLNDNSLIYFVPRDLTEPTDLMTRAFPQLR